MKKLLSLLLSLIMIFGTLATPVLAELEDTVTVFLNVSQYGEFLKDKSGEPLILAPIELSGKESYTLDDAFSALHRMHYDGEDTSGYASEEGKTGLYITKFWGDESGKYGYRVNGGTESIMGLSHEVNDGDYIDVAIYESFYPDTENYTSFESYAENIYVEEDLELTLNQEDFDENWNTVFSPCEGAFITVDNDVTDYTTDEDGKVSLSFESAGTYIISATKEKQVGENTVTAITAPVCAVTVSDYPDASVTVPEDAELFVGTKGKKHFVSFTKVEPVHSVANEDTVTYYFELADNSTYNYRVSGEDYVTYAGTFKKTPDFNMSVTKETLQPTGKSKTTIDRDTESNNKNNVADIYLNINAQGHLKLEKEETFQIVSLRNWQAVNNTSSNYFIEPDYHYSVIDENGNPSDIVTVDSKGLLTANKSGTAIVLVTYDAMTLNYGASDSFYGAIYPENTGVFVVSVDCPEGDFETGITINEGKNNEEIKLSGDGIDSEHDCIYYIGEQGEYTFTPNCEDVKVSVANPEIETEVTYNGFLEVAPSADNSFTIPLTTGRNIVKLEKDGMEEYQIITAKKTDVTINQGEALHRGDSITIEFDKLYHPANKLAGVYNMNAIAVYTNVSAYQGKVIGATSAQYNFANSADARIVSNVLKEKDNWGSINYEKDTELVIPADYAYDTFTLSEGAIYVSGWGDSYGNHRNITYENGKGANLNADAKLAYLGKLPDIEIPVVATESELLSITLDTENIKSNYFAGDKFDKAGLVVTANYEDGTTQIATNYSVSPEFVTTDTDKVTVTYRGKTAEIPVNVAVPKVVAIEISTPPTKTTYKEGDAFSPSGMVVNCVYENGSKKETTEYTYTPDRKLISSDTQMIISYVGEDSVEDIEPVTQTIKVTESSSSGGSSTSDTTTVYFTLLGDEKHGTPSKASETHTKKKGNLETWIPKTKITVDKGSYVIDVVETALSLNGIPYECEDNYISEIKGLAEFDNGNKSGWMYTLNGKYPSKGIDEQKVSKGDVIVFHYTDDYTAEKTTYSGGSSSGGSKGGKITVDSKTEEPADVPEEDVNGFSEDTFNDVSINDWYYEAVKYAYENNLMQGTDNGFEPDGKMTRSMLVTVLWRMEKAPATDYVMTFDDVKADQWYTDAVRWATSEEIVSGTGNNLFGTNDDITREQIATILYRYSKKKDVKLSGNSVDLKDYADLGKVSDYAISAMEWALASGIINGKTKTLLAPTESATRAEVATMLMRFCEVVSK